MPEQDNENIDVPTLIRFLQDQLGQQAVDIAVLKARLATSVAPSSVEQTRQE